MGKKAVCQAQGIDVALAPETVERDVSQCLGMIFGTPKGTVPYMREFGIESSLIDNRMTMDINEIVDESYEQTERYEPRIDLEEVEQETDPLTGETTVVLRYTIGDGEEEEEGYDDADE